MWFDLVSLLLLVKLSKEVFHLVACFKDKVIVSLSSSFNVFYDQIINGIVG